MTAAELIAAFTALESFKARALQAAPFLTGDPPSDDEAKTARLSLSGSTVTMAWHCHGSYDSGCYESHVEIAAAILLMPEPSFKVWQRQMKAAREAQNAADNAAYEARREAEERQTLAYLKAKFEGMNR